MRAVIQRISRARVRCAGGHEAAIGRGYFILLGVSREDAPADASWLAGKIPQLRLFPDAAGVMNLSLLELNGKAAGPHATGAEDNSGEVLLISQFTLHADARKGRRPHYGKAARPEQAIPLYEQLTTELAAQGLRVATGVFGEHMEIEATADGPVTILLDSHDR